MKIHGEELNKRGIELKEGLNNYHLWEFEDFSKLNEFFEALRTMYLQDFEDMVFRRNWT